MRTITAVESISLDGVMQGPGRPDEDERGGFTHGGWAAPFGADPEQARVMGGYMRGESDLAADLLDALLLLVHPLVLGHGRRLFAETAPHARLRLVDTAPTGAGVLINHYAREGVR